MNQRPPYLITVRGLIRDVASKWEEKRAAIYRRPDGGAGCCLHCLLDDGNFADPFLAGCEETAIYRGHKDCAELCRLLKKAKRTQREKITRQGRTERWSQTSYG